MNNLGWPQEKAMAVEAAYHEMYAVSDQWVQDRLNQAKLDGFVTIAFGLRLRTPLLHAVGEHGKVTSLAAAEGRTAGNA